MRLRNVLRAAPLGSCMAINFFIFLFVFLCISLVSCEARDDALNSLRTAVMASDPGCDLGFSIIGVGEGDSDSAYFLIEVKGKRGEKTYELLIQKGLSG